MEITWLGHSNFRIKTDDATVFIDPFFVGNPMAPFTHEDVNECDLVLLTHDHGDHLGQTLELSATHKAEVVAIFDIIQLLQTQGLSDTLGIGMNIGGTVSVCDMKVKMVQAMHSSTTGAPAGYIITLKDGTCIYYSGDTGLFGDMGLFAEFHDIDIAILPIGGHFTMDAQQAAYACKILKCKKVIPMHWGTFPILEENTNSFKEELAKYAPETEMVELKVGEPRIL